MPELALTLFRAFLNGNGSPGSKNQELAKLKLVVHGPRPRVGYIDVDMNGCTDRHEDIATQQLSIQIATRLEPVGFYNLPCHVHKLQFNHGKGLLKARFIYYQCIDKQRPVLFGVATNR